MKINYFLPIINSSTQKNPNLASKSANKWLKKTLWEKIRDSRQVLNGVKSISGLKVRNNYGTIHFSDFTIVILDCEM